MPPDKPVIAPGARGGGAAFVPAGNTGAVMAAAIMYLGRIKGIERPTLAGLMPLSGKLTLFLDVGANAACKPAYLLQFAEVASAYMERGGRKRTRLNSGHGYISAA